MDTLGFILRWTSGVMSALWAFIIIGGIFSMWRFDMWFYWWALIFPVFLLVIQARLTWKYRMFKPSDMMTQKQIEEKLENGNGQETS